MSDRWAVALALGVCAGAWWSADVPMAPAVLVVVAALVVRRPLLLVAGAALLAASLGHRAWAGLAPPPSSEVVAGEAVLVSDPVDFRGALRVDLAVGRRRVEAWARGTPAAALRPRLAGERVHVEGRLRAPPPDARRWLALRHVSARLSIDRVASWRPGSVASRSANGLRRTLAQGAVPLERDQRALLSGFLLGDDRDQSEAVADDFRAAGLTHLLAVSGQNVAFVLVLARPVLRRLGLHGRWAASLAVIAFFALLTRFEPSVLRAAAMAALAVTAVGLGRPSSRGRLLALAVAGVVVVDPLLVHSVGFRLSVGAATGILVLAARLARHIPGPRWLAEAVAVTVAAQVGVAPVLIPVFGGLPVASLPANLLAVPVAAPLMAWGLTAGLAAGIAGPPLDAVLHLPTSLLVGWVAGVARWAATLPLGQLEGPHVVVVAAITVLSVLAWRWHPRLVPPVGAVGVTLAVLAPALSPAADPLSDVPPAAGARLWRAGATVLVIDDPDGGRLLEGLHRQRVARVDLVVATRGTKAQAATVALLRQRIDVAAVLAPAGHVIRDAVVAPEGTIHVGRLRVVVAAGPVLHAEVSTMEP